ncbi:toll/interleukin-1 receptor domain-containing protein [Nocardioides caldifontis]|uniref:toll/interleukin-1 receptor domain-containing protein n=1 Tax=Nocardioides caldifontis TaxID=2588938 RepID=UPI0023B1FE1E|nr:toll/interleukin-1 receptor domain-containing protein [Nocardioides caldifontis]
MPESTPHAFISYVREDTVAVDELERVLSAAGIPVWRDVHSLFPGDAWKRRIKEAIQGDALAFLPVFSTASESRHKSQMREEIQLAIEEFRKMDPDQSWIFSVRLDDVSVPAYDITPTRVLTDLNWTNFFGPTKTEETTRLVARIQQLLGDRRFTARPTDVAATASQDARGALLVSAIREGVSNPARAADAAELVIAEARRVSTALNDAARFPLGPPEGSLSQAGVARVRGLTDLTGPLVEASCELGARGRAEEEMLATQLVASLAREGSKTRGGVERLLALRKLPAVSVLLAGAVGATATRNGRMLRAFVADPRVELRSSPREWCSAA